MDDDQSALEPLLELFLYAPIGMLYEYPDVLTTLVKRGKSQVQLAKLMGQMAKGADGTAAVNVDDLVGFAGQLLNKVVGEVGDFVASQVSHATPPTAAKNAPDSEPVVAATVETVAPFTGYDDLNAKSVISQLGELTRIQLVHVKRYEQVHKARKTVLAAVDRLTK